MNRINNLVYHKKKPRGFRKTVASRLNMGKALKKSMPASANSPLPPSTSDIADESNSTSCGTLEGPNLNIRQTPTQPNVQEEEVRQSRSSKKLGYFAKDLDLDVSTADGPVTYFLADPQKLTDLVSTLKCAQCNNSGVTFELGGHDGFSVELKVKCKFCDCVVKKNDSSSRLKNYTKSQRAPFHVNKKMVEAFVTMGQGHSAMEKLCTTLNMAIMSRPTFSSHLDLVAEDSEALREKVLKMSCHAVRERYESLNPDSESVIEITVSYDGSWQKRGFTSNYGLGFVIEVETGLVVDYIVLSKVCVECIHTAKSLGIESAEFQFWFEGHKSSCSKNYTGSSPAMERVAAEILWKRSIESCGFRYQTMVGDGDTKTVKWLNDKQVYPKPVQKLECLNHCGKRLGTALRNLVKNSKKSGITLGGGKNGNLSDSKIDELQSFYRNAIVNNIPHVQQMQRAILSTLEHYSSTDEDPKHHLCPEGPTSWCWYNKAKSNIDVIDDDVSVADNIPSHASRPLKFNQTVIEAMRPVYERMSSTELLSRCVKGGTSNANEALHHLVWNTCPKSKFQSKKKLEAAVIIAVSEFNMGCSTSTKLRYLVQGEKQSEYSLQVSQQRDEERLRQSSVSLKSGIRFERKQRRSNERASERKKAKAEGQSYGAGLDTGSTDEDEESNEPPSKKKPAAKKQVQPKKKAGPKKTAKPTHNSKPDKKIEPKKDSSKKPKAQPKKKAQSKEKGKLNETARQTENPEPERIDEPKTEASKKPKAQPKKRVQSKEKEKPKETEKPTGNPEPESIGEPTEASKKPKVEPKKRAQLKEKANPKETAKPTENLELEKIKASKQSQKQTNKQSKNKCSKRKLVSEVEVPCKRSKHFDKIHESNQENCD